MGSRKGGRAAIPRAQREEVIVPIFSELTTIACSIACGIALLVVGCKNYFFPSEEDSEGLS